MRLNAPWLVTIYTIEGGKRKDFQSWRFSSEREALDFVKGVHNAHENGVKYGIAIKESPIHEHEL